MEEKNNSDAAVQARQATAQEAIKSTSNFFTNALGGLTGGGASEPVVSSSTVVDTNTMILIGAAAVGALLLFTQK